MQFRVLIATAALLGLIASSHAEMQTRTSSFDYDASGLLTAEIIEPDQANLCLRTTYTYDAYGNKQQATTSNCSGATGNAVIDTRSSSTSFGTDGRFARTATNPVGHGETRDYDARTGAPTLLTGPNGLSTTWEYDVFGRKKAENRSDGTRTEWDYVYCSGVNGGSGVCPTAGAYYVQTTPKAGGVQNGPAAKVYYDKLNREIRTESESFNGVSVVAAYKDTEYDTRGRVARVSKPYFAGQTAVWTSYGYDDLGRVTQETQPATTSGTVVSATVYSGLMIAVTVSNSGGGGNLPQGATQTRTTVKNSQGQTASVTDASGNVVTYQYDSFSNLRVTTAGGINTVLSYDLRGRKTGMVDPDMGSWTYEYDVLGQLRKQTDAKAQVTTLAYDKLGRMTNRAEPDLISNWSYDSCGFGKGKLCQATSANDYSRTFNYDGQGRVGGITTVIGTTSYGIGYSYDASGRLLQTTYPNGFVTQNVYDQRGFLQSVTNGGSTVFWRVTSVSATGKVLGESLGNGLTQARSYDELDRLAANSVSNNLQTFSYTYDTIGNMTQRVDSSRSITENFVYDNLNRLLQSSGAGLTTKTVSYNAVGNITYKSDVGTYNYPAAGNYRPHAVSSITGTVNGYLNPGFTYDGNGNMTAGMGRALTYTSFNMPKAITGNGYTYDYTYNSEHERVRLQHSTLGEFIYLHPAGKGSLLYERETKPNGVVEYKNYINAGGALVGVYIQRSDNTTDLRYFHTDHLGSVTLITNDRGGVVEPLAYDAFGKRRYPNGTEDTNNGLFGIFSDRGFTGHEHLDEIALIHMNGRVYDPVLGRFMTPDPFVQAPDSLQDFNHYSYVNNNPLALTDPSGYLKIFGIKISAKMVAAVVLSVVTYGAATAWMGAYTAAMGGVSAFGTVAGSTFSASFIGGAIAGAAAGFVGGFVGSGGDFGAGFKGALAGGITGGVASYFGNTYTTARVGAEAVANGVSSMVQGGKFSDGFRTGVIFSGLTYAGVSAREYMLENSRGFAGQVGDSPGWRGLWGKLGGSRVNEELFQRWYGNDMADGMPRDDALALYMSRAKPSPLGGHQGGPGQLFGMPYSPGGIIDKVVEAFSGAHDLANSWYWYNANGTVINHTGFAAYAGEALNAFNVLLVSPVAGAGLLPEYARPNIRREKK
jgi:RHS repeat-associated protein